MSVGLSELPSLVIQVRGRRLAVFGFNCSYLPFLVSTKCFDYQLPPLGVGHRHRHGYCRTCCVADAGSHRGSSWSFGDVYHLRGNMAPLLQSYRAHPRSEARSADVVV